MVFSMSLVTGLVVGAVVFFVLGRGMAAMAAPPAKPTTLGWAAYVTGVLAFASGLLIMFGSRVFSSAPVSIALAAAAMVLGIGAFAKRDRHWPTWVALGAGLVSALFWIWFVAGEFVSPH